MVAFGMEIHPSRSAVEPPTAVTGDRFAQGSEFPERPGTAEDTVPDAGTVGYTSQASRPHSLQITLRCCLGHRDYKQWNLISGRAQSLRSLRSKRVTFTVRGVVAAHDKTAFIIKETCEHYNSLRIIMQGCFQYGLEEKND